MNKFNAFAAASVFAAAAFFAVQASADDASGDASSAADSASAADSVGENESSAFAMMVEAPSVTANRAITRTSSHGAFGYKYKPGALARVSSKTSE